jgi:NADPH:quinone reductase-like Zn-dependent oxidoreductase
MKAFILDRYGSKVALRLGEIADPDVREDDVLVQVHAAGVNLLDSKIRAGEFKLILPYRAPWEPARGQGDEGPARSDKGERRKEDQPHEQQ